MATMNTPWEYETNPTDEDTQVFAVKDLDLERVAKFLTEAAYVEGCEGELRQCIGCEHLAHEGDVLWHAGDCIIQQLADYLGIDLENG